MQAGSASKATLGIKRAFHLYHSSFKHISFSTYLSSPLVEQGRGSALGFGLRLVPPELTHSLTANQNHPVDADTAGCSA